ncbi:MAG: hypothetical protein L0Y54_08325 [Sporichthyaceae bacterium]|nr:hypothetical protein [Sporichthyaceae bacterium]
MTIRNLGDLIIYAGAVAAALAAIGAVLRLVVVRPLKAWLAEHIQEQITKPLGEVHTEVHPNHGASLRDAVTRTERKVTALRKQFDAHLRNHHGGG